MGGRNFARQHKLHTGVKRCCNARFAAQAGIFEHEHTPLYDIQRWAGQPGSALFDTLLVFQNLPAATDSGLDLGFFVAVEGVQQVLEHVGRFVAQHPGGLHPVAIGDLHALDLGRCIGIEALGGRVRILALADVDGFVLGIGAFMRGLLRRARCCGTGQTARW